MRRCHERAARTESAKRVYCCCRLTFINKKGMQSGPPPKREDGTAPQFILAGLPFVEPHRGKSRLPLPWTSKRQGQVLPVWTYWPLGRFFRQSCWTDRAHFNVGHSFGSHTEPIELNIVMSGIPFGSHTEFIALLAFRPFCLLGQRTSAGCCLGFGPIGL